MRLRARRMSSWIFVICRSLSRAAFVGLSRMPHDTSAAEHNRQWNKSGESRLASGRGDNVSRISSLGFGDYVLRLLETLTRGARAARAIRFLAPINLQFNSVWRARYGGERALAHRIRSRGGADDPTRCAVISHSAEPGNRQGKSCADAVDLAASES